MNFYPTQVESTLLVIIRFIGEILNRRHEARYLRRAKRKAEKQPSKEFVTPEQLGALAVFLCSDAAAQIRGAALPVDGGFTAQ